MTHIQTFRPKQAWPTSARAVVRALVAAAAIATAAGCSLIPVMERSELPVATAFPQTDGIKAEARAPVDIGWREFFPDERLQALIARALENNRDLRQATLRIEEARATYQIQAAELLPTLSGTGSAGRTRSFSPLLPGGGTFQFTQYQVGLSVSAFELDFFGRVRSLRDAALAQFLSTAEAQRAAQLSLVAQVARGYLAERALDEQRAIAARTLASREASLGVTRQRFDAGAASELDLRQAESLVEAAQVAVASLDRQHAQALNALVLLTGTPAGELPPARGLAEQLPVADLAPGLPSQLLANRPDVRAAEKQLVAANANIGAARAAFFPRIALTTSLRRTSAELGGLFGGGGFNVWSFMPQLTLPIFDAGRNRANLNLAEVRRDIGVAAYEQSIQVAFREVADALVARDALARELGAQQRQRDAERARLALVEQRRQAGVADTLAYLDAQRQSFAAEQAVVQTRLAQATNTVDLYVTLGGGLLADARSGS